MAQVYVAIGSNIDKHIHIPQVLLELEQKFGDLNVSPIYKTSAVGFEGEDFYNLVVGFKTELLPQEIFSLLRELEAKHQRVRESENQFISRTLDLDQLLYDNLQINDASIHIPNPDILKYAFVLKPLSDIAGEMIHPVLNRSIKDIWNQYDKETLQMHVVKIA